MDIMNSNARRIVLPRYSVTETTEQAVDGIQTIRLPNGQDYYIRPKFLDGESSRLDGKPRWVKAEFDRFPIVIKGNGEPWDEVNSWMLSQIEGKPYPNMDTFMGMAEDMAAYCRFLEENSLDWIIFPEFKLRRPTYRYSAHLKGRITMGELSQNTARRRMSRVINFYRSLISEKIISLANEPWIEGEIYIPTTDKIGDARTLRVQTTDVGISLPKSDDPFDETILDGGRLRPLPHIEQEWLLDALTTLNNPEVTLAHLIALNTGARIQTVLTLRVKHVLREPDGSDLVRIPCGPGTGIDTKNGVRMTLQMPADLYRLLTTYAQSQRTIKRRLKAPRGDCPDQYLFLSPSGIPLYAHNYDNDYGLRMRRHSKRGQSIRQYMKKYVIPFVQKKYSPNYKYRFHDLRATFGMNLVDACRNDMDSGKITYTQVLNMVCGRMCHKSPSTTEHYLKYRDRIRLAYAAQDKYEKHLSNLTQKAMEAINGAL